MHIQCSEIHVAEWKPTASWLLFHLMELCLLPCLWVMGARQADEAQLCSSLLFFGFFQAFRTFLSKAD